MLKNLCVCVYATAYWDKGLMNFDTLVFNYSAPSIRSSVNDKRYQFELKNALVVIAAIIRIFVVWSVVRTTF